MIFPPLVGQQAGSNVWITLGGFLITGVGLPFLGVVAVTMSGNQLRDLAGRAHPMFGFLFTIIVYLAIGPFFGVPRTATVSFEMGAAPFVPESFHSWALALFTIAFFIITAWLSLKPNKIVDWFGNVLTPVLLVLIAVFVVIGIVNPVGTIEQPEAPFDKDPFVKGFIEGYGTMDAIAALVFAIIVINAIKSKGIESRKAIVKTTFKSGVIAVVGLCLVYLALAYLGATSRMVAPGATNGGDILARLAYELLGTTGQLLLGVAVTLACLTTSVGLVSSSAAFFSKIIPSLSYKALVLIICVFTTVIANIGLTQLISITLPVLIGIYPMAIVLISVSFFHKWFKGYREVYLFALAAAGFIGFFDMLNAFGLKVTPVVNILKYLPFYDKGIGWIVPAVVLGICGYFFASINNRHSYTSHS